MVFRLVPEQIRTVLLMVKKVGICFAVGSGLLILLASVFCFSQQVDLVLVLAFGWLFVNTLANAQWIFYHKTWNATVRCTQDGIEVLYKEELLRKVSWDSIHCVQVRDVNGFFYGQDRDRVKYTYICLFLNGNANIPEVSYNRKFFEKDFLMIGYRLELHEIILQHVTNR